MSKEPKSPKGEKASDVLWAKSKYFLEEDRKLYDKLVSLEAKIELLDKFLNCIAPSEYPTYFVFELRLESKSCQSEYSELLKEHNL
jgi:hypothetical protein